MTQTERGVRVWCANCADRAISRLPKSVTVEACTMRAGHTWLETPTTFPGAVGGVRPPLADLTPVVDGGGAGSGGHREDEADEAPANAAAGDGLAGIDGGWGRG